MTGTAIVTGGARRIGRAVCEALGDAGYAVAVHYNGSADAAGETVGAIEAAGGAAAAIGANLADEDQAAGLIARAGEALGPVTVLINNASVFENDTFETTTRESWDRHMSVNLRAPFVMTQALAAALPKGQTGNVVNILDQRVWNLTPWFTSYTLSKAGLWTLTQTMALALAPRIRVNGIGPGPTLPSPRQDQQQFDRQADSVPLGRGATPREIADGVRYILSAETMTGQMIALDGGQHLDWAPPPKNAAPPEE